MTSKSTMTNREVKKKQLLIFETTTKAFQNYSIFSDFFFLATDNRWHASLEAI